MAKQRYYLDTRVLTAFFFAAMPFVAFGSFIVVNQAKNQLRESVGTSLEQRAVQTKLALEQYVAEQVVQLRLLAIDAEVQKALAAPSRAVPEAEVRRWSRRGPRARTRGSTPRSSRPRSPSASGRWPSCAPPSSSCRSSTPPAASSPPRPAAGGSSTARAPGSRSSRPRRASASCTSASSPGRPGRPSTCSRSPPRSAPRRTSGSGPYGRCSTPPTSTRVLAPVRIGRTGHAVAHPGDRRAGPRLRRERADPQASRTRASSSLRNAVEGFPLGESGQQIFGKTGPHRGYWTIPEVKAKDEAGRQLIVEPARLVGFSPIDQIPDVAWLVDGRAGPRGGARARSRA